jgi:hypothetical protein
MKRLFYLMLLLVLPFFIYGQTGYYIKDSTMVVGVKLIDGGEIQNSMQCEVEEKDSTLVFSPDELKEYGFKDGSIYVSRSIVLNNETKAVFLERLSKGATTLYYYKDKNGKKFFLEKAGGPLVEVYKKAEGHRLYKDFLKTYTQDCNQVAEALKLVSYTKYSLSKLRV